MRAFSGFIAILIASLGSAPALHAQDCQPWIAKVVSAEGPVQVQRSRGPTAQSAGLNDTLCPGDRIRVGALGRAAVQLADEAQTLIRLDEGTTLTFPARKVEKSVLLRLIEGVVHVFSRIPHALSIDTPLASAAIEGTEFALRVAAAEAELWVFAGRVRFSNPQGQLQVASGEGALARPGQAPKRRVVVRPREVVEWALHYPPLIDLRPEAYPEGLRGVLSAYRGNDVPGALAALEQVPAGGRDGRYFLLRAGLLLSVGRIAKAEAALADADLADPKSSGALALRSIIALVRDRKDEALRLAQAGAGLDPHSPLPQAALSYTYQGRFEIEKALEHARRAVDLDPEDALLWARVSELELSSGDLDAALQAAERAEALHPALARTETVLGFAYLTRIEVERAKLAFERAIVGDPADPLPRLGQGLAKIRAGDLEGGTREIETAASLDPNNSLVRSYLGKAYFEEKRAGLAGAELEHAKLLDPRDPTPWFYDALHKQTTNRPVEALHDLERAIALNDNRAVYRSKLLLDQDLAARSAALGRIYRDLAFEQRAVIEGWKSVNTEPADYSGHRLLADIYSTLPRHGIARVSELLQSQLLQPINVTPVQPNLAERDVLILDGQGPSSPAFNEFNPLFLRNRFSLQTSAVVAGDDTVGDEVTHSGLWNRFSYSLGQYHFETDGFRDNNGIKRDIYNLFVQASISPKTSAQIELRHSDTEEEDRAFRFFPEDFNPDRRSAKEIETARFGFHHAFSPNSEAIGSFIFSDVIGKFRDPQEIANPIVDEAGNSIRVAAREARLEEDAYVVEGQHLFRTEHLRLTSGFGYFTTTQREIAVVFSPDKTFTSRDDNDTERGNVYSYSQLLLPYEVDVTLGASADFYETDGETTRQQVNPKVGLTWTPFHGTTFRAAWFRALDPGENTVQTIEPTQVAGFNQFFGSTFEQDFITNFFPGTDAWRYGAGIDQSIGTDLFVGVEYSERDLTVPGIAIRSDEEVRGFDEEWKEYSGRAYVYWAPLPVVALSGAYQFERFERGERLGAGTGFRSVETHRVPLGINMFHPSGLRIGVSASYVDQRGRFVRRMSPNNPLGELGSDEFWVVDAEVGYRLPQRYGLVALGVRNLLDEDFNFQETDPTQPTLERGRTLFASFTLAF
jgi:tetratricopeptide (TPR) repeat protein